MKRASLTSFLRDFFTAHKTKERRGEKEKKVRDKETTPPPVSQTCSAPVPGTEFQLVTSLATNGINDNRQISPQLCPLRPTMHHPSTSSIDQAHYFLVSLSGGKNGWSSSKSILEAPDSFPIPCGIAARLPKCLTGSLARLPHMIRDGVEPQFAEVPSRIVREKNAQ